jgi:hypothetical protein
MTTRLLVPEARPPAAVGDPAPGPFDRLAAEQLERAERNRAAREEMRSDQSSVPQKIRAWEKLHGLQLPRDPNHLILRVIAQQTGLSMHAVLEEQHGRLRSRPPQ